MNPADPSIYDAPARDSNELSGVLNFFETIYRFRWHVITILAVAFSIGMFYTAGLKDEYQSKCTILIDDTQVQTTTYMEAAGSSTAGKSKEFIDTQLVVATSMPVLMKAAEEVDAKKYFNVESDQVAASILQQKTRAYQQRKTNIFYIEVVDYDPAWAAKFANSIAQNYIKESIRQSLLTNQQLLKLLPGGQDGDPIDFIEKMSDPYFIESLPSVQNNEIIQELKKDKLKYETELAKLKTKYTDANPAVVEMIQNIQHVDAKIKLETANIVSGLKRNLSSEVKSNHLSIFETAKIPAMPSGPNRSRIVFVFVVAGALLASLMSVFMGAVMTTVNNEEDLAHLISIPYLGHLPVVDSRKKITNIQELLANQSIRDAIAMLHTALIFSMPKDRNKLIMITSCMPGEGKSSISALLAFTMASLGTDKNRKIMGTEDRILLVEADIRRPGFSDKLNLDSVKGHPGLADFLIGTAEYDQIVITVPGQSNLDVITAGSISKNPEGLFTSSTFDDLVKMVEKKYTRVIFDSPPFLSIPEAAIISQKMHGTLFVIGAGMLKRKVLLRAIEKFRLLNTTLYGTVLNRLDTHHKKHYHGYKYKMDSK